MTDLQPGPDLNDRVAVEVMKWKCETVADRHTNGGAPFDNWCDEHGVGRVGRDAWDPSADISDAMKVVEKMREKGWRVHISDEEDCDLWAVEMWCGSGPSYKSHGVALRSLPHAICLAALEAVKDE